MCRLPELDLQTTLERARWKGNFLERNMPLADVDLFPREDALPPAVQALVDDAQQRIGDFVESHRAQPIVAYVPCEFAPIYHALVQIDELNLAPGHRFVEWGSGVGVASCLAAILEFDAVGIEIESELVDISVDLAKDHAIAVQFVCGSFIPPGGEEMTAGQADVAWLRDDGANAYEEIDLEPDDFDLVFSYPWPGEEQIVYDLFQRYGATGALLLTFHGQEGIRLQRKVGRRDLHR